ncbi:SEC-C domain-containing protein [Rhodanobacter sp. B2A1Ga4]|nr:SEC-C domain-containing protein [Rhodanobacter sp. B2A1Ga4]
MIAKVVPGQSASYLTVQPEPNAVVNECFPNVAAKIERSGGHMICGWQIWEWPHVMVEAEFHAVWVSPEGQFVDITPKPHGEDTILFVPDARRAYAGVVIDNVRMPVRDDLLVRHFIKASEAIVKVMNRGERSAQYGQVSVPAHEIEPLMMAQSFLGQSISLGLRDHNSCLCRSGSKYKRCHGPSFELLLSK